MTPKRRNPAKDQVAIIGVGCTPYSRASKGRSAASLALEACQEAMKDAGVNRSEVDGISGSVVPTKQVQGALGIPAATWWVDGTPPFALHVLEAMSAVFAGACTTALVYHANYRGPNASRSAAQDLFRRRNSALDNHGGDRRPEDPNGSYGYAGWAARYLQEFGVGREVFGHVVLNSRTNAGANPNAVYRTPLTMDDYLAARMVREPLSMLDMDPPVDAADAFIITTAERARDLSDHPVLIHAATLGRTRWPFADQPPSFTETGKEVAADELWRRSDVTLDDVDVFYAYDGFSNMAVSWFEALGYCKVGEAADYLASNWDIGEHRLRLGGRVPVNTHGGSLSEGGTQGCGHTREAVVQLRGSAGERQVPGARAALVTAGGFLWNAAAFILRTDDGGAP